MWNADWLIAAGNSDWKYWSPHTPPQPVKQASVAKTVSGSLNLASGIRLTPLNSGKNLANHRMSALAYSLTLITPCSLVARSKLSNHETKTRPCLTHLHTKWSFPNNTCSSFREVVYFFAHFFTASKVSLTRSGVTSITIWTVSKRIPRNTILVAGAHALLADSAKPNFVNKSPRNSKAPWALTCVSAPARSSK